MEQGLKKSLAEYIRDRESRTAQKLSSLEKKQEREWETLRTDILPTFRDTIVAGVSEAVNAALSGEAIMANPDDIRRQRKKLEDTLAGFPKRLHLLVKEEVADNIAEVLERQLKQAKAVPGWFPFTCSSVLRVVVNMYFLQSIVIKNCHLVYIPYSP